MTSFTEWLLLVRFYFSFLPRGSSYAIKMYQHGSCTVNPVFPMGARNILVLEFAPGKYLDCVWSTISCVSYHLLPLKFAVLYIALLLILKPHVVRNYWPYFSSALSQSLGIWLKHDIPYHLFAVTSLSCYMCFCLFVFRCNSCLQESWFFMSWFSPKEVVGIINLLIYSLIKSYHALCIPQHTTCFILHLLFSL